MVHRADGADRGACGEQFPAARIIGFPRGAGTELQRYLDAVPI